MLENSPLRLQRRRWTRSHQFLWSKIAESHQAPKLMVEGVTLVTAKNVWLPCSYPLRLQRRRWTRSHRFLWPKMTGLKNNARFLSLWRDPLLSACRFPSLTPVICHVFMHCLGSILLQDMFLKLSKHLLSRDKIWHLTWTHCLLAFHIVTLGPTGW